MKNIKIYFFISLFMINNCNSIEIEDPINKMNQFVEGPITGLCVNDEVWTVSLLNLNQWDKDNPNKVERDVHSSILFEGRGDLNKVMDEQENILKNLFINKKWEEKYPNITMTNQVSTKSLLSQQILVLENEFNEYMNNYLPEKPEFNIDESGVWMLMVHLVPGEDLIEGCKYICGEKKSIIDFRDTTEVKNVTLSPYFDEKMGKFKKYDLIKSWNILGKTDGWHAIMQAYFNQSEISFSPLKGAIAGIFIPYPIGIFGKEKTQFNCASFAMSIIRCCNITVQGGIVAGYNTTLCGYGNMSLNFTPFLLRATYFPNYFYRPLDRKLWKVILPELKKNQKLIDPTIDGLDLIDELNCNIL